MLFAVAAALVLAAPSQAAVPGANGRIVFSIPSAAIGTIDPDGTNRTEIPMFHSNEFANPVFSPDGQRIAFADDGDIYVMDPDGSHLGNVTQSPGEWDGWPSFSPDGRRIAFETSPDAGGYQIAVMSLYGQDSFKVTNGFEPSWSPDGRQLVYLGVVGDPGNVDIYKINLDGTGKTRLTHTPGPSSIQEWVPDWSPDGSQIAYAYDFSIWTMNADGTGHVRRTPGTSAGQPDALPSWSPDGERIAFDRRTYFETVCSGSPVCVREAWDVMTMNPDGSDVQNVTDTIEYPSERDPSWEAIRPPEPLGYVRPKRATTVRWPLVPAFAFCGSPNRRHGPPLASDSCYPPRQASNTLTLGSPDVTGTPAKSTGFLRMSVTGGNPATAADEAQVMLDLQVTDVRRRSDYGDYAGELRLTIPLRLTDKLSSTGFTASTAGTVDDIGLAAIVPCVPTEDTAVGATCALRTNGDALVPGGVPEGKRSIWQLGEPQVYDGGADGVADTTPNSLFARPGVFVP